MTRTVYPRNLGISLWVGIPHSSGSPVVPGSIAGAQLLGTQPRLDPYCSAIRREMTPLGPNGGIDIRLYQNHSGLPSAIVQYKAWREART